MNPKFNNKKQTLLWNVLTYGTAIAAGVLLGVFSKQLGTAGMAAVIVTAAVILVALYWWAYRTRRMEVEDAILQERKNRTSAGAMSETAQQVNIYSVKVHSSPTKVIMEALTVLLLIATWGIIWSQHKMGWDNIMIPVVMTIGSVGTLIAARFPFMMSDAEEHMDMSQISVSVKKHQIYALIFAIMALLSPIINHKWSIVEFIIIVALVEAYFDRKKKSAQSSEQGTDKAFDSSNIQVAHDKVEIAFYIVTGFIILTAVCFLLLSFDVINADSMGHFTRLLLIFIAAQQAITQLVKAVKYAKADKDLENIRQFRLSVLENRIYGVEFAIVSLIVAISIKHYVVDSDTLLLVILATLFGTFFIFKFLIKKAR